MCQIIVSTYTELEDEDNDDESDGGWGDPDEVVELEAGDPNDKNFAAKVCSLGFQAFVYVKQTKHYQDQFMATGFWEELQQV